jgi:hypothetical protein
MRRATRSGFSFLLAVFPVLFSLLTSTLDAQQRQPLQTHASAPAGAKIVGQMPSSQHLSLALTLPLRNQGQLNTLLQQLEDPASPNYHQYLTVAQFTEQFGPTDAQYQQVVGFAQSHGLTVTNKSLNRVLLNVTGSVANIEQTFRVTMQIYQHPTETRTFFAPNIEPTVDASIPLLSVSGLSNFSLPHPMLVHAPADGAHSDTTGSGPGGQFYGSDIRAAYYGNGPLTGGGQALALAELGQWNMADVQAYFSAVGQSLNVPIVTELLGGTSGACPGDCDDGEEVIDIQQIISMAPGASVLIVYEDTSGNADIDIFNAYATDNIAKQMSFSFGIGDGNAAADEQAFQEFHAQGQNFFVASGDEGANLGDGGWPGYSQNVIDVGGTDLTTASAGGAWASETGWVGSGTGWCDSSNSSTPCYQSPYDAIPSYQAPVITGANGGSTLYRNLPDISAEANTDNFFCSSGTCQGGIGGTSLAAPRWAGFLALANEQAAANGETIGFLNPLVYTIGQGPNYDTAFHDITSGSNPSGSTVPAGFTGSFTAMTGFDMVTGWGTPNGSGMIDSLAPTSTTNPYFTLAAAPSTLNLTPGGATGTTTISLTSANGFTGTVTLSANVLGAPTGVTASFNPISITGSGTSILTVSTTSATPAGTLMLAVTGTGSGGIQTQPAFVTLALPDFSLSVSPSTIYLNQSSTTSPTVTVNSQNGFNGTVNLSVSSLPSGVTGSFSPSSTESTSTLTLTASSTAATVGSDYLTVSGISGNISPLNAPYSILSVSAATGTGGSGTPVGLSSAYNLNGIYTDGTMFSGSGGMDGLGSAYSSNLLTGNRVLDGVQFNFGPANQLDAAYGTGQPITLPAGQFTTLQLLATGIDGPILSQNITVTYTDSTTSTFTQSFSDWCSCSSSTPGPGQQPGESFAVVMPYRDLSTGAKDERQFNLYGHTFVLNSAKTVQSLTLPNNRNVIVLAATLTTQSLGTQVSLASQYNVAGLYDNGVTFPATGGMDGGGNNCTLPNGCADGYSAQQLGLPSTMPPTLAIKGALFNFGPVNTTDCTTACVLDEINLNPGVNIALPANQQTAYTTMTMLGTGVQGSHTGKVTVTYTTGSPTTFNQTFSDWCNFDSNPNESVAVGGMSRINSDGTLNTGANCNLYAYTYSLDSTRTVQSIALANTDSTKFTLVAALTLAGNSSSSTPGYTLSAGTANPTSIPPGGSSVATVTVTPAGGYTGTVTLSCSISPVVTGVNAPTCGFSPNPVSVTSSAAVSSTLTFTTVGASGAVIQRTSTFSAAVHAGHGQLSRTEIIYAFFGPISGLVLVGLGFRSRGLKRKQLFRLSGLWVAVACAVILPSCGGGSSGGGGSCSAAPSVPTGLAPSSTTSSGTTLNWAASTVGTNCSVTGYTIYQNGTSIATTANTTYNVTGLSPATQYNFTVASSDSFGASAQSSAVSVTTPSNGTPAGTYTISITGLDANGVAQSGAAATVAVTVN